MQSLEVDLVAILPEHHRCVGAIDDPPCLQLDHHQVIWSYDEHVTPGPGERPGHGPPHRFSLKAVGDEQHVELEGHQRFGRLKCELGDSLTVDDAQRGRVAGPKPNCREGGKEFVEPLLVNGDQHIGISCIPGVFPGNQSEPADHRLGRID